MSDDLENEGLDIDEASFDDFEKKPQTLGDLWRGNSMVKIGAVVVAAVAIFGAISFMGGSDAPINPSVVPSGSDVKAPPGTEQASPSYVAAVEEQNENRTEEAIKTGGSSFPTPIDPDVGRLTVEEDQTEAEDPLKRWRQLQEERLQREMQKQAQSTTPLASDPGQSEAQQALADAMQQQMQSILTEHSTRSDVQTMNITSPDLLKRMAEAAKKEAEEASKGSGASSGGGDQFFQDQDLEDQGTVLMPAGEILYAQLLLEANSDVEGPVLAMIVSGPLAGNKALGSFAVKDELLTLTFTTVIIDGESVPINAIAIDPKTTLPAMATDVEHHYFKRIVLPMAAAFVSGAASAISESGLTDIQIQGDTVTSSTSESSDKQTIASGVDEAGQVLEDILNEMADDTETTVIIAAGTPMGLLFLQPVVEGGPQPQGGGAAPAPGGPGTNG